jgi:GrpB-like predicted nucleotidyltransferase (UPF0157 family)
MLLNTMKISIAQYSPTWPTQFNQLKKEIAELLKEINPVIEHIGSTSVPGLAAKPIIDIQIGVKNYNDFPFVVEKMMSGPFIYYQVYEDTMPNRRLFVRLKNDSDSDRFPKIFTDLHHIPHAEMNEARISNIHVWKIDEPDYIRHLAFRDYLIAHPIIKQEYADLKIALSNHNWKDMNEYNGGKNAFIKKIEAQAMNWYRNR